MNFSTNDSLNDSFDGYQRSIRDRAAGSMYGLRGVLDMRPAVSPEARRHGTKSPGGTSPSPWERSRNTEHCDYSYGAAADRLKNLLQQNQYTPDMPKTVQFDAHSGLHESFMYSAPGMTSSMRMPRGDVPAPEETVALLQNQATVIQQLDAENKYLRDELKALKQKVLEAVQENSILHEEIKKGTVREILKEGIDVPGLPRSPDLDMGTTVDDSDNNRPMSKVDFRRWHQELQRVTVLHTAKTTRLEAQLAHAREELEQYEREVDSLRSKVRMCESLSATDPELRQLAAGLCVRCAENEAVLAPSGVNTQRQSVERLTNERDQLMEQLTGLKARFQELRQREEDSYQQVKSSVQLVEEAQLEMTTALVQREQLKEELSNTRQRMGQHAEEMQRKMQEERELVRGETRKERDQLHNKVKDLESKLTEYQLQMDKLTRDKMTLTTELDTRRGQLDNFDMDFGKATDSMKVNLTQATIDRNAALTHSRRMRNEMEQLERDRDNERIRMKTELENLRHRLQLAEKELVETKEECIQLHSTTQALEREAHLAKLAKETIEKSRGDDVKSMMKRAEQREMELNLLIDKLEAQNEHSANELEGIVNSQSSLILKLREECRKVTRQLEDVTVKYKSDNRKLKTQNEYLRGRLDKTTRRQRELEECTTQHGLLQDKMRSRIKEMDSHSTKASQQVLDLLARESSLMRDRHLLAKEVEFLRKHLVSEEAKISDKLLSSTKHMVDDVLNNVRQDEDSKANEIFSKIPDRLLKQRQVDIDGADIDVNNASVSTPSEEDMNDLLMDS